MLGFALFLLLSNFNAEFKHLSDQRSAGYFCFFSLSNFNYILWFRCVFVEEGHKYTDLQHVHKLSVESFLKHLLVGISNGAVQDLGLVLADQESYGNALTSHFPFIKGVLLLVIGSFFSHIS